MSETLCDEAEDKLEAEQANHQTEHQVSQTYVLIINDGVLCCGAHRLLVVVVVVVVVLRYQVLGYRNASILNNSARRQLLGAATATNDLC